MSFDLEALTRAVAREGRVVRVLVANAAGSVPREAGAAMLVWEKGQAGTIGGGALEFTAIARAREALRGGGDRLDKIGLGADLGQCCGGGVFVLTEIWDKARLQQVGDAVVRPLPGTSGEMPLKLASRLRTARNGTRALQHEVIQGWLVEPLARPTRQIWVWGAGHVGRAIVSILAPLPDVAITWVDVAADRFPDVIPEGVSVIPAAEPATLARHAPEGGEHLILTYSHALDLALCHAILTRGFARCGLIGSRSKWARFQARLAALGHAPLAIARIDCPIGDPSLGKHPQMIAIGVAARLATAKHASRQESAG